MLLGVGGVEGRVRVIGCNLTAFRKEEHERDMQIEELARPVKLNGVGKGYSDSTDRSD